MMATSGEQPTYTHTNLQNGRKGYIVKENDDGTVVMRDDRGQDHEHDTATLYVVWAHNDWRKAT